MRTRFEIVGREPDPARKFACRRMIVGPWLSQPEQFPGYNGFVGWSGVTVLKSGRWLVTFNAGYWHASMPVTEAILEDPACRAQFDRHLRMGCPDLESPRGGRTFLMHSDDGGLTWSTPRVIIDTEHTDCHAMIAEMDNGALLCSWYVEDLPDVCVATHMRSHDGGETWGEHRTFSAGARAAGNESALVLSDGTVLHALYGYYRGEEGRSWEAVGIHRSRDHGETWERIAVVGNDDHHMHEQSLAELPDGRIVLISRAHGDIAWSEDGGETWTEPESIGISIYDPHLIVTPDGVLAAFAGSYFGGGLRVTLSPDGGRTWHGPGDHYGYDVDASAYGYNHPILLDDGSVYVIYQSTGGHHTHHARTMALWGVRVKVSPAADGIEMLPARGSPADIGYEAAYDMVVNQDGPASHRAPTRRSAHDDPRLEGDEVFDRHWTRHAVIAPLPRDGWKFRKDRARVGEEKGWARPGIDLDGWHDIRIGDWWDAFGFHHLGTAWYRLEWTVPEEAERYPQRLLAFGAVDGECAVYVDGAFAGAPDHGFDGWETPFEIDVTSQLAPGSSVVIAVKVRNSTGPAGIWRSVKLIAPP
ncbi:MAG: hypothetical protein CMJ18_02025 [Phycisphaeraceae bacterium]|nr:hypothetical protein [Phycisphaeraceae bacterium]